MEEMTEIVHGLRAPFPWFGGKSKIAPLVWERLGNVANYVEPFFGSGAVLLARPHAPQIETVNDKDAYLTNFYRAIQHDPDEVVKHADHPVDEVDLLARHRWLLTTGKERLHKMKHDPDFYDVKVAGWWVWGICIWIGSGWCDPAQFKHRQIPSMAMQGINRRKLPMMRQLGTARMFNADGHNLSGQGENVREYFQLLAERMRRVRICCGQWDRLLGPAVTTCHGITGVFLDPPYLGSEHTVSYAGDGQDWDDLVADTKAMDLALKVREWCIENGHDPLLRIALAGYEAKGYTMPDDWECVAWSATGGYGLQGDGQARINRHRERIWFSPNCLKPGLAGIMNRMDNLPEESPNTPVEWPTVAPRSPQGDFLIKPEDTPAAQPRALYATPRPKGLFDLEEEE